VLTYHNDNARTGQNLTEQILTTTNINNVTNPSPAFGKLYELPVDGLVDGQPLIKTQVTIAGVTHNVLYVVTENDTVYAFRRRQQRLVAMARVRAWTGEVCLGQPGMRPGDARDRNNLDPRDRSGRGTPRTIYVVAMSRTQTTGAYFQRIHALDMTTGAEEFNGPVTVTATFRPVPAFSPAQYKERAGLLCWAASLITGWASHCDFKP